MLQDMAPREDSPCGDTIILALHTGLRKGELLGLRWDDIDLDTGRISVGRALQYLPGEGLTIREPKTGRGRRTLPIGPTALDALRCTRRRQLEDRLALGPAYQTDNLVFATRTGGPVSPNGLRSAFDRMTRWAGLDSLRFHDLRHAHASFLLARGVHPKIVSERLGHASIAITLDTYSHVLPNLQEDAVRDLDAWLAGEQ